MARLMRFFAGLGLALLVCVSFSPPAAAAYDDEPIGPSGWVPDGPVHAVVSSGGRVFVGGGFTGGVAALDASTGALLWSGNADGGVRGLAVSSDGTHLIAGGTFKAIGGEKHLRLASLKVANGSVEPAWKASASGAVRDIVLRGDVAYFGGFFQKHNGVEQRGLGAVLVSTGKPVPAFDFATDANVHALATDGQRLFVGGRFLTIGDRPRNMLASVNLTNNVLDAWTPPWVCTGCNLYWDVLVDSGTVYTAGRNYGAVTAFSATTGARGWRVAANGDGQALALADGVLYAGGHFTEIGPDPKQPRSILAALNPTTGSLDPDFRPRFVGSYPGIWALSATSDRLYVGGHFSSAGNFSPRRYPYFAMFE